MIEVLKQMVAELGYVLDCINQEQMPFDGDDFHETLRLGRQAIAELESQEPVAYINVEKRILEWAKLTRWETPTVVNLPKIPLYTHPPQRTEQEAESQEPKCVVIVEVFGNDWRLEYMSLPVGKHKLYAQQYLYTHPPQRTWVGLTDEEIKDAGRFSYCRGGTSEKLYHIMWNSQPSACIGWSREELIAFTKAVEAKYQEKNQ